MPGMSLGRAVALEVPQVTCPPGVPTQTIAIVNEHQVQPFALARWENALVLQSLQLRDAWTTTPCVQFGPGGWTLTFVGAADLPAGDGGYHSEPPEGVPEAQVDAAPGWRETVDNIGVPLWEVYASHELLEMVADASGVGEEVCDPVENDYYLIDGVGVSAFITPTGQTVDAPSG